VERPVHSRSPTLSDQTSSFAEYTPAPHLRDCSGSFTEHTYKVLIAFNVVAQLQLHYAPYPDLKPALLPRCPLALHCPLLVHILVLLETRSFFKIQFCQITFVLFLCAIAKPYESLLGYFRLSPARKQIQKV